MKPQTPTIMWLTRVVGLSAILIGLVAGVLWWRYGSLQTASSVLTRGPVFVVPRRVDLGSVEMGAPIPFDITLRNGTDEAVSVLGIDDCCYCRLVTETPVLVPAHGRKRLQLVYTLPVSTAKSVRTSVLLITSSNANQPLIQLVAVLSKPTVPHLAPPRPQELSERDPFVE